MPINLLREKLNKKEITMSTRLWSTNPFLVETVGSTKNFDYFEFVAEYAPFTQPDFENLARAAELNHMSSMIKVDFQNRYYIAQKAIASGFQAVMFTDHKTAEEVEGSIKATKADFEGEGCRFGRPNRRFIGFSAYIPQLDYAKMINDTVRVFMIEKNEAVKNIDEICSVEGVDMVQFGPSDFAMSNGKNLSDFRPEARNAEEKVIKSALAHGVAPRCEITSPDQAKYYLDLGVRNFSLGDEIKNNLIFWQNQGSELRSMLKNI